MKKFLKILFIVLLVIFIVMLSLPLVFKGQIMEIARREVNKSVRAKVDWSGVSISLFKGFPDVKVSLENLSVSGIGAFEGDTLIAFREFSAKVDLLSAISGRINVKSIILDRPVMRAIMLNDSTVNWDITYPSEELEELPEDTSETMDFEISLKEFLIQKGEISYYDAVSSTFASISDFDFNLSGNFKEEYTLLNITSIVNELSVDYDGIKYLNKAKLNLKALLEADLVNMNFQISDNELIINDIIMGMEGSFNMPNDTDIDMDIRFFTRETSFKSLLSMIPAIYMQDFEGLKTSGKLEIEGTAKGTIAENSLPKVYLNLLVNDGFFSYPDLPESVSNVAVDLKVFYDGAAEDNSEIDLLKFYAEIAGNPVNMNFSLRTPMTDMQMNGMIDARIDLATLRNALPLEDFLLEGKLNTNISLMGKMSDIENENYEAFKADGVLEIMDIKVEGKDLPVPVNLKQVRMLFSPRYVYLETFNAMLGSSDIQMNGKLENFIPYVFENEIIKGELNVTSGFLDMNELLAYEDTEEDAMTEDTTQMTVFRIPSNIDFKMSSSLSKVIYDKLVISNLQGLITVRDGIANMNGLQMNALDGTMVLNGEYNTRDITTPMVELDMQLRDIDVQQSFYAFNTVQKLAPVAEMTRGKATVNFDFVAFLDSTMYPILNTLVGKGSLHTDELKLENNETFTKIGNLLKKDDLAQQKFRDINLNFDIREGRVYIQPFETRLGSSDLKVSGDQGLDMSLNYDLAFRIPRDQFGSSANDLLESFASQAQSKGFDLKPGDDVNVGIIIGGSFEDPKISMDILKSMNDARQQVKEAVIQNVREQVEDIKEEVKEEVKENVNAEIDSILKQAEEEAAKIREAAKQAGEDLVGEARLRKNQLVKEAGNNPLKKLAAEKTGDGLIKTAENQAKKLNEEADTRAQKIIDAANQKAEELKNK